MQMSGLSHGVARHLRPKSMAVWPRKNIGGRVLRFGVRFGIIAPFSFSSLVARMENSEIRKGGDELMVMELTP